MKAEFERERAERAICELVEAFGLEIPQEKRERLARRVVNGFGELFSGVGVDARPLLREACKPVTDSAGGDERAQLVVLRGIQFRSVCEDQLLPFYGLADLCYIPGDKLVGFGAVARAIDVLASRPQLQERLSEEIAQTFEEVVSPRALMVRTRAQHDCLSARSARQQGARPEVLISRGLFAEDMNARATALSLLLGTENEGENNSQN